MFYRSASDITEIEYVPENAESIGKELRNCWSKCVTENSILAAILQLAYQITFLHQRIPQHFHRV